MTWFSFLQILIKLIGGLIEYTRDKKLMDAAEARILSQQMEELNERVKKSLAARDAVSTSTGLRDDDGYRVD